MLNPAYFLYQLCFKLIAVKLVQEEAIVDLLQ